MCIKNVSCVISTHAYSIDMKNTLNSVEDTLVTPLRSQRTSTVGRGRAIVREERPDQHHWSAQGLDISFGNSLDCYSRWAPPTCIVSDGAYGVLGFEGDTSDHSDLPAWYEPHIANWSKYATPQTTLWFWNSEIGWAAVHPVLERYGWKYVNANIWNKGKGHVAGNVNTAKIRRFPVVTEICVQYVFEAKIQGRTLQQWLISEWKRTGLTMRRANEACGVKDAAVRKYLDAGHLWYYPPSEMFEKLQVYANTYGDPDHRPYFSIDGEKPATRHEWDKMRSKFYCPYGHTNVWDRPALRGAERVVVPGGQAVHLNQKPLDLMQKIIEASTDTNDAIWEPFGGLFSASIAAQSVGRRAFSAEIDQTYFHYGLERIKGLARQRHLL